MSLSTAGNLGTGQDLVAATNTTVYQAPDASHYAVGVLAICNRDAVNVAKVRYAVTLTANANPSNGEWREYGTQVGPNAPLNVALTVGPSQKLVVYSDSASVSASFNGIEQTTT